MAIDRRSFIILFSAAFVPKWKVQTPQLVPGTMALECMTKDEFKRRYIEPIARYHVERFDAKMWELQREHYRIPRIFQ